MKSGFIIEKIKQRMEDLHLSQRDLSFKTRIPITTLNRLLSEGSDIKVSTLLLLMEALEISPEQLFNEKEELSSPFLITKTLLEKTAPSLKEEEKARLATILFQNYSKKEK